MNRSRAALLAIALSLLAGNAMAQNQGDDELFRKGVTSLNEGAYDQAITVFEELADRGFSSPEAAFNRGLSYLARVRARAERPGDLGRAAAGFEEAVLLGGGDVDAEQALDLVRSEVARRSIQRGGEAKVHAKPSLGYALVMLASEKVWAILAMASSVVFATGLLLRRKKKGSLHIAGLIASWVGAVSFTALAPAVYFSREIRRTSRPAIVVAPEARIVDEKGVSQPAEPIPEASRLDVVDRKGLLVKIRYGALEGWTHASSVRLLAGR